MTPLRALVALPLLPFCLLASVGCAAGADPSRDDTLDLSALVGKSDLADLATPLTLGEPVIGEVAGHAFALFFFAAQEGDVIRVQVTRTGGEYDPRTDLFTSLGHDIPMDEGSFDRTPDGNTKTFTLSHGGKSLLAVRASHGSGAGGFSLVATCVGGPCAGEYPHSDESVVVASVCIGKARSCAFGRLASSGVSTQEHAFDLFIGCLDTAEHFGAACAGSCEVTPGSEELCYQIIGALQWYADKDVACHRVVDGCYSECVDRGDSSPYIEEDELEFWMTDEAVCWEGPELTTTCDEYARAHEVCGGVEHRVEESFASCMVYCEAIHAYFSDTDDVCGEGCGDVCVEVRSACESECGFDDGAGEERYECYDRCVAESPRASDDRGWGCDFIR